MGDLPDNEKYKDFSEWSNSHEWSTQLLKNTKIFQEKKKSSRDPTLNIKG